MLMQVVRWIMHWSYRIGTAYCEGFLCLYVSVIMPQSKWKEINAKQNEIDKLLRVMRKI